MTSQVNGMTWCAEHVTLYVFGSWGSLKSFIALVPRLLMINIGRIFPRSLYFDAKIPVPIFFTTIISLFGPGAGMFLTAPAPTPSKTFRRLQLRLRLRTKRVGSGDSGSGSGSASLTKIYRLINIYSQVGLETAVSVALTILNKDCRWNVASIAFTCKMYYQHSDSQKAGYVAILALASSED